MLRGAGLLVAYSLGLGVPFLDRRASSPGRSCISCGASAAIIGKVEKAMGALLVVTGVLFVTGQITTISFWLLSLFPALARIG